MDVYTIPSYGWKSENYTFNLPSSVNIGVFWRAAMASFTFQKPIIAKATEEPDYTLRQGVMTPWMAKNKSENPRSRSDFHSEFSSFSLSFSLFSHLCSKSLPFSL